MTAVALQYPIRVSRIYTFYGRGSAHHWKVPFNCKSAFHCYYNNDWTCLTWIKGRKVRRMYKKREPTASVDEACWIYESWGLEVSVLYSTSFYEPQAISRRIEQDLSYPLITTPQRSPLLTTIRRRHNDLNMAALNKAHFLKPQRIRALSQSMLNAFNKSDSNRPSGENGGYDRWNRWSMACEKFMREP